MSGGWPKSLEEMLVFLFFSVLFEGLLLIGFVRRKSLVFFLHFCFFLCCVFGWTHAFSFYLLWDYVFLGVPLRYLLYFTWGIS